MYVNVGELAIVNESLLEYDGAKRHNVILLYWCKLENTHNPFEYLWHREHESRPLYPEGVFDILLTKNVKKKHYLIISKSY